MSEKNKFYVYALVDPRDGQAFYIGKGCGKRAWSHLKGQERNNPGKALRIADIRHAGLQPRVDIIKAGLTETEALSQERSLILAKRHTLTNIAPGAAPKLDGWIPMSVALNARSLLYRLKDDWEIRSEGDTWRGTVAQRLKAMFECRAQLEALAYGD